MALPPEPSNAVPGANLAWVGERTIETRQLPCVIVTFENSDDFLLSPAPFDFEVYVISSEQSGVGALDLIRLLRRRTAAGIVTLCKSLADEFVLHLGAGADMVLGYDVPTEHVKAAIDAVARRASPSQAVKSSSWKLLEAEATLETPEGKRIPLSESDLTILQCFAVGGGKVARQTLIERLWGSDTGSMDNALHATLYRLRKRIEQTGQTLAPVYAVPKVGYEFRAPLAVVNAGQSSLPGKASNMSRKSR